MAPESKAHEFSTKVSSILDPQHHDCDAKVILISSDNVSFGKHAWYMAHKRYVSHVQLVEQANKTDA
jgi:hypothetical protein